MAPPLHLSRCVCWSVTWHISKDRQSLSWDCMKQDRTKASASTAEELHNPGATQASHQGVNSPTPNTYRVTVVPLACQMLSEAVRNNHEDKPEPALHGVSLKHHEFVVLNQYFRPACKQTPLPAAVLHCFLPPHRTLTLRLW